MLNSIDVHSSAEDQNSLLEEIRQYTKKKVSQMTVKPGQEINRHLKGGVFILDGNAVVYKRIGGRTIFIDRLSPGRIFVESLYAKEESTDLALIAEGQCTIAVASLKELQFTNRMLAEKINQALFNELYLSCKGAHEQVCSLRNSSAKGRLIERCQYLLTLLPGPGTAWMELGISSELFREMANVSSRQFGRLLPELKKEGLITVSDGEVYAHVENVKKQTAI